MKDKKKIVIGTLCALIMIMAVGYALLSQQLSINGTANITSTWKIEITNITEKERHGGVTEKSKSYDAMTANFDVGFTSPGDYITYDVEVTNSGTLDAVIERVNVVTNDNPAIIYTTSGIESGTEIPHNSKKYLTVKIEYDSSVTSQPQTNNNGLTLQLFSAQNLGQVQPEYQTYSIGDKVTFAGSDWYVIKNSAEDEDYVTLLKETRLTAEEIGNSYSWKHPNGNSIYIMPYYWSPTCHQSGTFGTDTYTDTVTTGCSGHNNYDGSKIKMALEEYMKKYLGSPKLKEVEGYKIRLIKFNELINDLGGELINSGTAKKYELKSSPNWVRGAYYTMTPNESDKIMHVAGSGEILSALIYVESYSGSEVRPVINLYKSAIE